MIHKHGSRGAPCALRWECWESWIACSTAMNVRRWKDWDRISRFVYLWRRMFCLGYVMLHRFWTVEITLDISMYRQTSCYISFHDGYVAITPDIMMHWSCLSSTAIVSRQSILHSPWSKDRHDLSLVRRKGNLSSGVPSVWTGLQWCTRWVSHFSSNPTSAQTTLSFVLKNLSC